MIRVRSSKGPNAIYMKQILLRFSKSPAFTPLHNRLYRWLWTASLASNIGTMAQNVGQGWLMTSLTPSPLLVALVQTAESFPLFLLALPAGALADLINRRRLLLFTQTWMAVFAAGVGLVTALQWIDAPLLLCAALMISIGNAFNAPAWQATVPDVVAREQIPQAVNLNGVSYNVARVLGPAIGGLAVAYVGPAATFFLNSFSFVGVIIVLIRWKPNVPQRILPAERLLGAMRTGVRYLRHTSSLQVVLLRVALFIFFASSLWALLPLYARKNLGLSALGYGSLLGCLGAGAITAAAFVPAARARWGREVVLRRALWAYGIGLAVISTGVSSGWVALALFVCGIAWLTSMASFQTAAQTTVPPWVRARALSFYLIAAQGGLAFGSFFWGLAASRIGVPYTFLINASALILTSWIVRKFPLPAIENLDLSPSVRLPTPPGENLLEWDDGPVLVTVTYQIDTARTVEFKNIMTTVGQLRRRTGAFEWGLFGDPWRPGKFVETFFVETWAEHMRQHDRMTAADRGISENARSFEVSPAGPEVTHWIYAYPTRRSRLSRRILPSWLRSRRPPQVE